MLNLVNECLLRISTHNDVFAPAYNEHRTEILKNYPSIDRKLLERHDGILDDVSYGIGGTPLIAMDRIRAKHGIKCRFLAKAEFLSAGGSVKDRLARRMVELIESEGKIKKGDVIVEATSGNTGIGLALMCAVRGYQAIIVMPEKMSAEKANTLKALGAIVIRTRTSANWDDQDSHITTAYRLVAEINSRSENSGIQAFIPDQYKHQGNVLAHYQETATEILKQTDNECDCVVIGAGTGGTISGVGEKMKEVLPHCVVVGVDPKGSILHKDPGTWSNKDLEGYEVEGIGYDFYPPVLHRDFVDEWIIVNDHDSFDAARELIRLEGMLVGGSSGTALAAAIQKAKMLNSDQTLVVILPDNIRNYLTKFASDDWMTTLGFMNVEDHPLYTQYTSQDPILANIESSRLLDTASISLGQLPTLLTTDTVAQAYAKIKTSTHAIVRDADTLIAVLSRDDLHQAALNLRGHHKPIDELCHSSHLLVVPGSFNIASIATLCVAAEGAMKSRDHAIIMVQSPHSGYSQSDLKANRHTVQKMSSQDQTSGLLRLVTKDMVTEMILNNF